MADIGNAQWIWYPGEFELWLSSKVHVRRRDHQGVPYPPIWYMDRPSAILWIRREVEIGQPVEVTYAFQGEGSFMVDGVPAISPFIIAPGHHTLTARIYDPETFPAFYLCGDGLSTDSSWSVGLSSFRWVPAWCEKEFGDISNPPEQYRLPVSETRPASGSWSHSGETLLQGRTVIIDFGYELYGYPVLNSISGSGEVELRFGESREESESEHNVQKMSITISESVDNITSSRAAAFRYLALIIKTGSIAIKDISVLEEAAPSNRTGNFRCSDEKLEKIWQVSARTLELATREFLLDGIKRDHWVWSGDAYQEILMAFYLYEDTAVCRRSLTALRGKPRMEHHMNTILDYSLYWVLALWSYYLYSGDRTYLQVQWENLVELIDFCSKRSDEQGLLPSMPDDWVFVDWAPMDNSGEVTFEQILWARALEIAGDIAAELGYEYNSDTYRARSQRIRALVDSQFWNADKGAFTHNRKKGVLSEHITRYPNMFALFFGYLDEERKRAVMENVLLNEDIQPITTPYMRFYELEAMCQMGQHAKVLDEMRSYWGGMLDLGATSFWEYYDPSESGLKHYEMYGDPFGKSLCHGWGASPLYLIGRYYLGVTPTAPGYKSFTISPSLGDLEWFEGRVPVPGGNIDIFIDRYNVKIYSDIPGGRLVVGPIDIEVEPKKLVSVSLG